MPLFGAMVILFGTTDLWTTFLSLPILEACWGFSRRASPVAGPAVVMADLSQSAGPVVDHERSRQLTGGFGAGTLGSRWSPGEARTSQARWAPTSAAFGVRLLWVTGSGLA